MQNSSHLWPAACLLSGRPNVGALMSLCEENHGRLLRLAPRLRDATGRLTSRRSGGVDLLLEVEEQAPYTTQLRLTHVFHLPGSTDPRPDPNARLRVYHDARQVEILDLRQSVLPLRGGYQHPALADKWQANLFLAKWLTFCLRQGHCFQHGGVAVPPLGFVESTPFCT
ncbi:DUF1249 domain-containing protein [Thiocystis minor]|uniref:DUF1249 domain-containing protein n=1 Tax=Thiocystis minor TaxID=61597 RepID=UPI001F5D5201|nr:DUF1249 domain-containing protein [Thiocystis minor]